jgi:hypothetical protein
VDQWSARRKAATYTQDNTNRINANTDIHALSGIRSDDPSVRASEDSSCLRPHGHSDRRVKHITCWLAELVIQASDKFWYEYSSSRLVKHIPLSAACLRRIAQLRDRDLGSRMCETIWWKWSSNYKPLRHIYGSVFDSHTVALNLATHSSDRYPMRRRTYKEFFFTFIIIILNLDG